MTRGHSMKNLSETIMTLASHEGGLRERLIAASSKSLYGFSSQSFSETVQELEDKIRERLSEVSKDKAGDDGPAKASIKAMDEKELKALANDILAMYFNASREYHEDRNA